MIANLFVLAFVIFMAYWWGSRGLFSAVLHLASTVIAGAMAFALWEPMSVGVLLGNIPPHAWGVGLLAPFILWLLLIRTIFDKTIKGNLHINGAVNMVAGGVCGLLSAILSAGICMIALGYMSLGPSIGGIESRIYGNDGNVIENQTKALWIDVDRYTAAFYSKLSAGAFSTRTPLKHYRPNVDVQAASFRVHTDTNASKVAMPGSVTINGAASQPTPFNNYDDSLSKLLNDDLRVPDHNVLCVYTSWTHTPGTYDGDDTLRIASPQIQLITRPKSDPDGARNLTRTIGASVRVGGEESTDWEYVPFVDNIEQIAGVNPSDEIAFFFIYPTNEEPLFIQIRSLRFPLENIETEDAAPIAQRFGTLMPYLAEKFNGEGNVFATGEGGSGDGGLGEGEVGDREGVRSGGVAKSAEVTNALPEQFSRNVRRNLELQDGSVFAGTAEVPRASGARVSPANAIKTIYEPGHKRTVRVEMDRDQAQSLLGRSISVAGQQGPVFVVDDVGRKWDSLGWVWRQGKVMEVRIEPEDPVRTAGQTPAHKMGDGDDLYLYFRVNPESKIVKFHFGDVEQTMNLTVE